MIEVKRSDDTTRKVSPELAEILKNAFCVSMKDLEDACMTPTNKEELKRYIRANKNILNAEKEYYERKFKLEKQPEDKHKKTTERKSEVDLEAVKAELGEALGIPENEFAVAPVE